MHPWSCWASAACWLFAATIGAGLGLLLGQIGAMTVVQLAALTAAAGLEAHHRMPEVDA